MRGVPVLITALFVAALSGSAAALRRPSAPRCRAGRRALRGGRGGGLGREPARLGRRAVAPALGPRSPCVLAVGRRSRPAALPRLGPLWRGSARRHCPLASVHGGAAAARLRL